MKGCDSTTSRKADGFYDEETKVEEMIQWSEVVEVRMYVPYLPT